MTFARDFIGIAVLLVLSALACACGGATDSTPTTPSASVQLDLADMVGERSMGSPTAPVTMTEYSSLTCAHCATFHATTLAQIRAAYVDTGRVRYVYRDFPLDSAAVAAGQVARCAGSARYFEALDALYRTRTSWANSSYRSALRTLAPSLGLSAAQVDACLASTDLQSVVLQNRQAGIAEGVNATPTFFVNGTPLVGAQPYAQFQALFDR